MRKTRAIMLVVLPQVALVVLAACNSDGRTLRPAGADQTASVYTTTTTIAPVDSGLGSGLDPGLDTVAPQTTAVALPFALNLPWLDGGAIDARFTCNGADVHPEIGWLGTPAGAVEMALVVRDIDAGGFVHWMIAGLDPQDPLLGEGDVPIGAIEGLNGFSTAAAPSTGWRGPCPPAGASHHYTFTLYALGQQIELPTDAAPADLQAAIDASTISSVQVIGVYPGP